MQDIFLIYFCDVSRRRARPRIWVFKKRANCKALNANHLRARGAPKSLILKGLRALFYSTSLLETILVEQVIEILKCLAKIVNNVFNQFKFFGCSGLPILKTDALCDFGEVFFCHNVFFCFFGGWWFRDQSPLRPTYSANSKKRLNMASAKTQANK
jgi:hypothetical protein